MAEQKFQQKTLAKTVNTALQETEWTTTELSVATPGGRFQNKSEDSSH